MNKVTVELGLLKSSCFVIMPFSLSYKSTYDGVIRPAIERASLECIRGDEVFSRSQISHEIWQQIRSCRMVVAELTGKNPNVLYELGLAHALGKPAIIITRNEDDVPSDLKALRYLFYDVNDPFWGDTLGGRIEEMCRSVLAESKYGDIFEGISFSGQVPAASAIAPIKHTVPKDISGVWIGKYTGYKDVTHTWNVHIAQNENRITGTIVISYQHPSGELIVVQQTISGTIKESIVLWSGTSYSYLQRPEEGGFVMDGFEGAVDGNASSMTGMVLENDGNYSIVLKRTE